MSKQRTHTTWWNRLLSGVLCLALVLGLLPAMGLVQTVEAAHWADPYGEQMVAWGIMNPSPDLRLGDTITRAEFVAMCNRAFGYSKLGGTPFVDVPSSAWYAQDIDIAYNAGYFNGGSYNRAYPNDPLTREQAAVLIARNMMLQETVGESQGFTDSRDLSEWSRGLIGAAVAEGMITGYSDGSFLPFNNITRGEVAAMLVRVIGNPVSRAGSYEMNEVYGNVTISSSNVTLRNTVILGNLYVTGGIDLGNVLLENVTVLGRIIISGGGESEAARSSVILRNVAADELVVDSLVDDRSVTISAYGFTDIPNTYVRSDTYLEDSCEAGYGLRYIELNGPSGTKLQLAGKIKEVRNKTPRSKLQLVKGTAEEITVDEYAIGSELLVDINTRVDVVNLDVATRVYGEGDIINLNIWADGCEVEILPEHMDIRPGLSATLVDSDGNETEIGSTAASELSSEPRLRAGYPSVTNLRLNQEENRFQVEGLYSGNKPGTIYWAVSAIADGSVSEKNLLNNPAYGGNIFEGNAGSIVASSKTEYGRQISKLEPDGSYYISAILVDNRGNRSPLKVISFTTPDNTTPEFVEEPYMSKVSCETAQVTTMINKNCQLYWVLLKAGATAPTVQNFKSGTFGGSYGYGSQSVAKNVPVSIKVNSTTLQQDTYYDLYLWLNDFDGTLNSDVFHVKHESAAGTNYSFRTPDETPPVVTSLTQTNFTLPNSIEFNFSINEASTTLYWSVVPETDTKFITPDEDLSSLRVQMRVVNGPGALVNGHKDAASANTDIPVNSASFLNGGTLDPKDPRINGTHNFRMYYVAKDADDNYSEVKSIIIHTADNEPPIVTIDFSSAMYNTPEDKAAGRKPRPQADSDIILIFSEQVKGDSAEDAKTFVDLYNEVARYESLNLPDSGDSLLKVAKDNLGKELAKHITLHYVQPGRDAVKLEAKPETGDPPLYGWINLREATVALQADGTVRLTLPSGKAVQMGGGMEYYFHFEDIFDDSYTANRLAVTDDNGKIIAGGGNIDKFDMESFTTIYAQVWLQKDGTGISNITGNPDINGEEDKLNGTRLDIVFDVIPQSTVNSNSKDCWDMIIWSDVPVHFYVYRRMDDGTGTDNWGPWEQVSSKITANKNIPISLSYFKDPNFIDDINNTGTYRDKYETVTDGLLKDVTYQYGICFTRVGTSSSDADWEDTKSEPQAWSELITMSFSLVAGTLDNIKNLSNAVNRNYNNYVANGTVSEIGSVRSNSTTETILDVEKQFNDQRPPAFLGTYPTFTASTSSIEMKVNLSRAGTLYYLAVRAEDLVPSFKDEDGKTVTVTPSDDGRGVDEDPTTGEKIEHKTDDDRITAVNDYFTAMTNPKKKTYVPVSGTDRDNSKDHIYFMTGGPEKVDPLTKEKTYRGTYSEPSYDDIFDGDSYAASVEFAKAGSYYYTGLGIQTIPLDGSDGLHNLQPDTWYYVYIVLQSDSDTFDEVVQVYRVKTAKVTPPSINVVRSKVPESVSGIKYGSLTTGVSMTVIDRNKTNMQYDNAMLYYALSRKDDLPPWFSDVYTWTDTDFKNGPDDFDPETDTLGPNQMTVLDAMISKFTKDNKQGSGLSYFDRFAGDDLKSQVMNYITVATSDNAYNGTTLYYDAVNASFKLQECADDMNTGGEYVMLVCARHYDSDENNGKMYGFAATKGLFMPDKDPPKFMGNTGLNEVMIEKAYKSGGARDLDWGNSDSLAGYTFDFSFTISFDKAIYTYDNGVLKQIVGGTSDTSANNKFDPTKEVALIDLINSSDKIKSVTGTSDGRNFTITFDHLASGWSISIGNLYNSSGVKSDNILTLTFRPTTRLKQLEPSTYLDMWAPCFNITWAKSTN